MPDNIPARVHGFDVLVRSNGITALDQARGAIVVIDSGVEADLDVFGGRVTKSARFPTGVEISGDDLGHGSVSASIAAGGSQTIDNPGELLGPEWGSSPLTWNGMVPNAQIWAIGIDTAAAYDPQTGSFDWAQVHHWYREALDQVLAWQLDEPNVAVAVTMINAFPTEDGQSHIATKLAEVRAAGISVTSAAGNGPSGSTDPRAAFTLDPGVDPTVIGAGALVPNGPLSDPYSRLAVATGASVGTDRQPGPDLAVVVDAMPAVGSGGEPTIASGTSAASATIAAGSLLLQVWTQREFEAGRLSITGAQLVSSGALVELLTSTADRSVIDGSYSPEQLASGSLDLPAAADEIRRRYATDTG